MMDSYTDFAYLYDTFMEDVPYEEWCDILCDLIEQYNPNAKSVLDLGCGTGTLSYLLADRGYEVIGADISPDMLMVANEKNEDESVFFICQDMREIELAEPVDVVVSVCDSINYMLTDEDMKDTFKGVYDSLVPGGVFIFDFNTVYKYETVIGDTTIAENREDCSFIWENYYDPETSINEYDVTFFVKDGYGKNATESSNDAPKMPKSEDLFRRFTETHVQKGYTIDVMLNFAENAGFEILEFREAFDSFEEADSSVESDSSEEYGEYEEAEEYAEGEEYIEHDECEEYDVYEDIFDRDEDKFERVYLICRKPEMQKN